MFKFLKNNQKYLDVPVDKREKAHRMLDSIIDEPDSCVAFNIKYNLNEYIKGLKTIYTFKESE